MARLARIVLPKTVHHVTQRGNRRQPVFFENDDYAIYIDLIATFAKKAGTKILAYCLMPNHVHFAMVPKDADGLRATLGEAHRRYTRHINFREQWRGHLWQERFHSFPMDDAHLWMALRYIELNPVTAKIVDHPADWPWSSARAHLDGVDDRLVRSHDTRGLVDDWSDYLEAGMGKGEPDLIERHLRTGRLLGNERFIAKAESRLGRTLKPKRPGPKRSGG
ncbi:transposase [Salinisphaera sp.]|uniref:transposase n=1 Tax=Salinisphaera sp. TaxID=1914330 RepID=UPI002D772165|nr:transposase [Salinisphaera sp.]HET7314202.1 transposase [Salinisphaera sp.]